MNRHKLPNTVFAALSPEKLDRMIEAALAHPQSHQQVAAPVRPSNIIPFPAKAAWFTGTGALAASLFLAIALMPTPHQTVSAGETSVDMNDLIAYQTLSQ